MIDLGISFGVDLWILNRLDGDPRPECDL